MSSFRRNRGPVRITIPGGPEMMRRLDFKVLAQPEVEKAVDTIANRPLRTKGAGLGTRRNTVTVMTTTIKSGIGRRVHSTGGPSRSPEERDPGNFARFNPRVTGIAWTRKNVGYMIAVSRRALPAAHKRMRARFSAPLPKD